MKANPKIPLSDLAYREYWTCAECARILGRGADYWRCLFDAGRLEGYRDEGTRQRRRYIAAESARRYLKELGNRQRDRHSGLEARLLTQALRQGRLG